MEKEYLCTLRPLDMYFFGGERTFRFNPSKGEGKTDYYIVSEDIPQQSTLFGALRFLILKNKNLLNDIYHGSDGKHRDEVRKGNEEKKIQQQKWIGRKGFSLEQSDLSKASDYGNLYSISPVFLLQEREDGYHRWIPTPMNQVSGPEEKCYRPLEMGHGFDTEMGADTLLPMNYDAKEGIVGGFLDLDDTSFPLISSWDVFDSKEHTRIARWEKDQGLFKKKYKTLKKGLCFAFYCRAEEGTIPATQVFVMGQEKSPFAFTAKEVSCGEEEMRKKIGTIPAGEGLEKVSVYYAWSDLYLNLDEELHEKLSFSIVKSGSSRTLSETGKNDSFRLSRDRSDLYQMIQAGSVFYISSEKEEELLKRINLEGLKQIGLNYLEKVGGNN